MSSCDVEAYCLLCDCEYECSTSTIKVTPKGHSTTLAKAAQYPQGLALFWKIQVAIRLASGLVCHRHRDPLAGASSPLSKDPP